MGLSFADLNAQSSTAAVFGLLDPYSCSPRECGEGAQLSFGVATGCSVTPRSPVVPPLLPAWRDCATRLLGLVLQRGIALSPAWQLAPWDPPALSCRISFVLFDCSPRTRLCWKVWAMSSRSSSKPRKPPQRSYRESEPLNPASGWALGPGMVFACQGRRRLSHPRDINRSEQNPTRTMEVLLQIRARGLSLFPQPHLSRQLWYFSKGQC